MQAAEIAGAAGVPVICFANEPAIVAPGLFRLGVDPDHVMETIIEFSKRSPGERQRYPGQLVRRDPRISLRLCGLLANRHEVQRC